MKSCPRILVLLLFAAVACILVQDVTAAVPAECVAGARMPDASFTCAFADLPVHTFLPPGPPYTIQCTDRSNSVQAIKSWKWEFGDGGISTQQSPRYSYPQPGSYHITLTVTTVCGNTYTDSAVSSMEIYCSLPEPQFTVDTDTGFAPLTVHVRDTSSNTPAAVTTMTYWYDDTHRSVQRNPVFVFGQPGTYTISQAITKTCVRPLQRPMPPYEKKITVNPPLPLYYLATTPPRLSLTGTTPADPAPSSTTAPVTTMITPVSTPVTPSVTPLFTVMPAPAGTLQSVPATTAPETAGTGTLSVITDPAGARVYVDGVLRGASPAVVPNLETGSHVLLLERDGYRNMTVPVDVSSGKTTAYSTALVPVSGDGSGLVPLVAVAVLVVAAIGGLAFYLTNRKKAE